VCESDYSDYLKDYHSIALKTGKIERIYWHQLIATGYGLVDNREGKLQKLKALKPLKGW
jgi:hypothetical protein